ncbi:hypothetical protein LCGC14_1681980 [marine sediment metagenome]|uniref:Uncharacterized protein n=1 Tax=marine sediment metagenome TaxID=412755 RepID=A0A0F9K3U3_9ZZZZ
MPKYSFRVLLVSACLFVGCDHHPKKRAHLTSVKFRIVAERDDSPLSNRELQVFDGRPEDVRFEFVKTKASAPKHYLTSVTTDAKGFFTLDLSDSSITGFVIQPGLPYDIVRFERSSDIGHTKSADHVRVIRLKKGTRQVFRNDIFDLRRHMVKQIGIDKRETELPFQEILLTARELTKTAQPDLPARSPSAGPAATAKLFLEHLHAGRAADAFQMYAINEKMSKRLVDEERSDLERISVPAKAGTWHLAFIEVHVEGAGAVAVVNEDVKRGQPSFDLDPLYLVRLEGQWWIIPGMTKHDPASVLLSEEEYAVFNSLEQWFKTRKHELKKAKTGA